MYLEHCPRGEALIRPISHLRFSSNEVASHFKQLPFRPLLLLWGRTNDRSHWVQCRRYVNGVWWHTQYDLFVIVILSRMVGFLRLGGTIGEGRISWIHRQYTLVLARFHEQNLLRWFKNQARIRGNWGSNFWFRDIVYNNTPPALSFSYWEWKRHQCHLRENK